jgi:hypothetical protein
MRHLTSSMGVRIREVTAPDIAPAATSAGSARSSAALSVPVGVLNLRITSCATRYEKNKHDVSAAAPNSGALTPLYNPLTPSCLML